MNTKSIGIGILVLAVIGFAVVQFGQTDQAVTTQTSTDTQQVIQVSPTDVMENKSGNTKGQKWYRNGQYSASASYETPEEPESISITITLDNDVVTDATFTGEARDRTSREMQALFAEGFKEQVVGKQIDEIALTVVNGSSLTPKGFMDALQKVKQEASA